MRRLISLLLIVLGPGTGAAGPPGAATRDMAAARSFPASLLHVYSAEDALRGAKVSPDERSHRSREEGIPPPLPVLSPEAGAWTPLTITPRSGHAAVYDPVRRRMLIIGGEGCEGLYNSVTALSLSPSLAWRGVFARGEPPGGRDETAAVYDSKRDRVVMFGGHRWLAVDGPPGRVCQSTDDTWELSLAGTPTWRLIGRGGPMPRDRHGHVAIFDPLRDRVLLFGGSSIDYPYNFCDFATPLADLWELRGDGAAWKELTQTGDVPPPGAAGSAVYDQVRDRMLFVSSGRVWALALGDEHSWTMLQTSGPAPSGGLATYDAARDRVVVFDGAKTWALGLGDPMIWSPLTAEGAVPILEAGYSAVWDFKGDRVLVFGGYSGGSRTMNTWSLTLGGTPRWSVLDTGAPLALSSHSAHYDPSRDRMIVIGDYGSNQIYDFSLIEPGRWTAVPTSGLGPGPRAFYASILDAKGDRVIEFGGTLSTSTTGDASLYELLLGTTPPRWRVNVGDTETPAPRIGVATAYDSRRNRVLTFGGWYEGAVHGDVWELGLEPALSWTPLAVDGPSPSPRFLSVAAYDPVRDRMIVFGGTTLEPSESAQELWALDLASSRWELLSNKSPRVEYSLMLHDPVADRVLLVGGRGGYGFVTAFDLTNPSYPYALDNHCCGWDDFAPAPRSMPAAIYDPVRDGLVVVGGYTNCRATATDLWSLIRGKPRDAAEIGSRGGRVERIASMRKTGGDAGEVPGLQIVKVVPEGSHGLMVSLVFTGSQPARLDLVDVGGRLVATRRIMVPDRGSRTLTIGGGAALAPGVYFVRATQAGRCAVAKTVVLR